MATTTTSSLGLSGLASGVDTSAIVDQLMAIDRQSTTRITYRQSNVTGLRNSPKAIASKLSALKDAAKRLYDFPRGAGRGDRPHAHDDPRDAGARLRLDRHLNRLAGERAAAEAETGAESAAPIAPPVAAEA
jgi:hypothetical protein